MNHIWSAARDAQQRAKIVEIEAELLAKNPDSQAQRDEFARIAKREIVNLFRAMMSMGVSVLTKIDQDMADTMRDGIDLIGDDRDCPPEQIASCLSVCHPDAKENEAAIEAFRVTAHGFYIRREGKDMFFQAEPLAVK